MNEQVEQIYNLYVDQQLIDPNNVDKETFAQANPEQASRLYELGVEKNLFQNVDQETFMSAFNFMDVKKKDSSDSTMGQEDMASDVEDISLESTDSDPESTEVKTAFEKRFGKNNFTDLVGDIYRAWHQGKAQGASIDESLDLWSSGENVTNEQIQDFIEAQRQMQNQGVSDEMQNFSKIYEENGGGWLGFIKGVSKNMSVIPQLFVSSVAAMANPTVAKGAGTGAAVGGGAGAAATLGPGAIPGAIGGAIFGATTTLEAGLTFAELLQEEIGVEKELTNSNIRAVLEDEEAMKRIKRKAIGRGMTIGAIDAITGGVTSKVVGKTARTLQKAKKASDKTSKVAGVSAGIGTEAAGGSLGEVAGRVVAGQEMDVAEIGFEGVAGTATAPLTVGIGLLKTPQYKLNGEIVPAYEIIDLLEKGEPADIAGAKIEIKNDNTLLDEAKAKKESIINRAAMRKKLQEAGISDEVQLDALIDLEVQKLKLKNNDTDAGKNQLKRIEYQIESILNKGIYDKVETVDDQGNRNVQVISITRDTAADRLKKEGVDNPSEKQIDDKLQSLFDEAKKEMTTETEEATSDPVVEEKVEVDSPINEEQKEIADFFNIKVDETTEIESLDDNVVVNKTTRQQTGEPVSPITEKPVLQKIAQAGIGAVKTLMPDLKIVIHDNTELFNQNATEGVNAEYNVDTKTIHINADQAGTTTIPHELFHAVLIDKVGTETAAITNKMIKAVDQSLGRESALKKQLEEFASTYDTSLQNEEQLAELTGVLAANFKKLSKPEKNIVLKWIKELGQKIGFEMAFINQLTTDEEATIDLLNTLSRKFTTGEEVTVEDVSILETKAPKELSSDPATRLQQLKMEFETSDLADDFNADEFFEAKRIELGDDLKAAEATRDEVARRKEAETKPKKTPSKKLSLTEIARRFNMDDKGFIPANNILSRVQELVRPLGLSAARAESGARDIFITKNGRKINPVAKRQQKGKSPKKEMSLEMYIQQGRDAGFTDIAITEFLTKTTKKFKAADVQKALTKKPGKKISGTEANKASSLNRRAIKKLNRGRLGNNPDFNNVLAQILSVPIGDIKAANIKTYNDFLNKIAKREKVTRLDKELLKEATDLFNTIKVEIKDVESDLTFDDNKGYVYPQDTQKIIDRINDPKVDGKSLLDQDSDFIENSLDKLNSASLEILIDKLNLAETTENSAIVEAANDYAKNRQSLLTSIAKQAKQTTLNNVLKVVKDQDVGAKTLVDISKSELGFLSGTELNELEIHLKNIEDGFYTYAANKLAQRIEATDRAYKMKPIIDKVKSTSAKLATMRSRVTAGLKNIVTEAGLGSKGARAVGVVGQMIRSNPLSVVDQMFANYKDNTVRENVFDPTASAYSKFQNWINKITDQLEKVENLIAPTSKENVNESVKRRFEITTYLLQKEFEGNDNKKGTASAVEFINKTVEKYNNDPKSSRYTENDIKILEDILNEYSEDNQISLEKMDKAMSPKTKKAIGILEGIYGGLAEKQSYATSIVRGEALDLVNNYVHHKIEYSNNQNDDQLIQASEYMNLQPGTKSKTAIARTEGAKAIDFDPISTALRGVRNTGMDYYLSNQISTTRQSLTELKKIADTNKEVKEAAADLKKVYNEALGNVVNANMSVEVVGGSFMDKARKIGYYAALASVPRAAAEFTSNLVFASMSSPLETSLGMTKYFDLSSGEKGRMIIQNTGATTNTKLYNDEQLGGSKADQQGIVRGKKGSARAAGQVGSAIEYITRMTKGKRVIKGIEKVGEFLISTPDQMISRPLWFGTFAKTFKDITGKEVDYTKISENNTSYMKEYADAIKKSRQEADKNVTQAATSNSPFSGVLKNQINKDDSGRMNLYRTINSYMSRFSLNEYATARQAIASMAGKGQMSQIKGAGTMAGILSRMSLYVVLYRVLSDSMFSLLDVGEDEKEEDLKDLALRQSVGAGVSLLSRGMLGNIPMIPINLGIEEINKEYGFEFGLRNKKEYNPYEHSIVFAAVNSDQLKRDPYKQALITAAGPYTPQAKSLFRLMELAIRSTTNKSAKSREKNLKELFSLRTALELSNMVVGVPLYRDIRAGILKEKFKSKPSSITPLDLKEIKKYDPKLYEEIQALKRKQKEEEKKLLK